MHGNEDPRVVRKICLIVLISIRHGFSVVVQWNEGAEAKHGEECGVPRLSMGRRVKSTVKGAADRL